LNTDHNIKPPVFESDKKEKILFFLYCHGLDYAREIARTFEFNLNTVQNQLLKLESHGISAGRGSQKILPAPPEAPRTGKPL